MNTIIFLGYAVAHSLLFGLALSVFLARRTPSSVPLLLVTGGLIYDNLMLAVGSGIGEGQTLAQLSVPRFFLHALTTPLLMITGYCLAAQTWASLNRRRLAVAAIVILMFAMIAVGFWQDMLNLSLELQRQDGVISYGNAGSDGPPLAPIVTMVVLLAAGLIVWWKVRIPWLALGAIVQFAAAMLADAAVPIGNFGEVALLAGLVATHWQMRTGD